MFRTLDPEIPNVSSAPNGLSGPSGNPEVNLTINDALRDSKKNTDKKLAEAYNNPVFIPDVMPNNCAVEEVPGDRSSQTLSEESNKTYHENLVSKGLSFLETSLGTLYETHKTAIKWTVLLVVFCGYNVYLGFAIHLKWNTTVSWCDGVKFLVGLTALTYFIVLYYCVFKRFLFTPCGKLLAQYKESYNPFISHPWFSRSCWLIVAALAVTFLVVDSRHNYYRLVSACGLVLFVVFGYLFSAHPRKIIWRHIFWGILLQFLLGLLVLRWNVGREFFECLGSKTQTFLDFTDQGSSFVFGYLVTGQLKELPPQLPIFAFKVLSVVIFFSFIISILYFYGIMQVLVMKVGWFLHATMGTTACESMNASANIFLGMTEAPLMIKPYLTVLTKSELHAVMTGGFATISGAVLAAYINFGVSPSHLLSASAMSAPAALAYAKLFYPETEESKTKPKDIVIQKSTERNAIEAAANGASSAVALVANIAANLVAFLACIHFLNANLSWFGGLVDRDYITFEWLLSQVFRPVAFIMGVRWDECQKVGKLIGLKIIINEFVAYQELGVMLKDNLLSSRAEAIAVFALCGFSNIGSIGISLGALSTMAPNRRGDMAAVALRAMIAGTIACFTTACIAGALLDESVRPAINI